MTFAGFWYECIHTHTHTHVRIYMQIVGVLLCAWAHLNATLCWIFNLMYLINHVDPFCAPPMNCLTPASRACLSVPKSCPAQSLFLPLYPHTLLSQSHFVFVFCFFLLLFCLAFCFCFCFFFVPVIVSFSFKPLSNACSFLLAAPVDGLHLFSIRFGVFLLCSHIFITAYRLQAKDWLALLTKGSGTVRANTGRKVRVNPI